MRFPSVSTYISCMRAKHPQYAKHAYSRGPGACPPRKFLKIRCQKSEFDGTSATTITYITEVRRKIVNSGPYMLVKV